MVKILKFEIKNLLHLMCVISVSALFAVRNVFGWSFAGEDDTMANDSEIIEENLTKEEGNFRALRKKAPA